MTPEERQQQEQIRRMVFERERCISRLRYIFGTLPRPAVAAVYEFADKLMELHAPGGSSEDTFTGRAP